MNRSEQKTVLESFRKTLGQELHNLKEWPEILWQQMYNRLQWVDGDDEDDPVSKVLAPEFKKRTILDAKPWFHQINRTGESESLIRTLKGHKNDVNACAFSPDGRLILSASKDHTLRVWNAANGKCLQVLKGHTGYINACRFSPNGRLIISGSDDKTLRLWDSASGVCVRVLRGHTRNINACDFSPNSSLIVSASGDNGNPDDNTLRVWDVASGACIMTLKGHYDMVFSCGFSPDGCLLISASGDMTLRLWDAISGECMRILKGPYGKATSCFFTPDGRWIISIIGGGLVVWDVATRNHLDTLPGNICASGMPHVWDSAVSPDGTSIVTASKAGFLIVWNIDSGRDLATLRGHAGNPFCVSASPDSCFIISGGDDNSIRMWRMPTADKDKLRTKIKDQGHFDKVKNCKVSPRGSFVVTAGGVEDCVLRLWDPQTGNQLRILGVEVTPEIVQREGGREALGISQGHSHAINGLDISSDGTLIISASGDGTIKIWKSNLEFEIRTIRPYKGHSVWDCAVSPDISYIVSAGGPEDCVLSLWDTATGRKIKDLAGHTDGIYKCVVSPDGSVIISASRDKTLKVWDPIAGKLLRSLEDHTAGVVSCAVSPDGNFIISISEDNTLKVWERLTYNLLYTIEIGNPTDCAVTSDGAFIVSTSALDNGSLDVWDRLTGKKVTNFPTSGELLSVATDPTGSLIVCGEGSPGSMRERGGRRRAIYIMNLIGIRTPEISSAKQSLLETNDVSQTKIKVKAEKPEKKIESEDTPKTREELLSEALENSKSRRPGTKPPAQEEKVDLSVKKPEDDGFVKKLKESQAHLRPGTAQDVLPRLRGIAQKEEKAFFHFLEKELRSGRINEIKPDDIGERVMGIHTKPTAISLLFEMLGSHPEEPPRLAAGRLLFSETGKSFSKHESKDIDLMSEWLKPGLVSDSYAARNACMWAIFKLKGAEAFDICSRIFSHHNPEVRFETARLFGFLRDKRATISLIKALRVERIPKIRSAILWALGYIKDPGSLQVLIDCLDDKDPEAAGYAAWALGEIGGPEARKALAAATSDVSKDREVRDWAAKALLKAGLGKQTKPQEDIKQKKISMEEQTITCKCGHKNPVGERWCKNCGREL